MPRSLTDLPALVIMKISWHAARWASGVLTAAAIHVIMRRRTAAPRVSDSQVTVIVAENRLVWQLTELPVRIEHIRWGQQDVTLEVLTDTGAGVLIEVTAHLPFELEVEAGTVVFYESVPAGRTRYVLTYLDRSDVRRL